MAGKAESSKSSVNERLARAREEDLRRSRNLQAKLARAQDAANQQSQSQSHMQLQSGLLTPALARQTQSSTSSSSSRAGLMFLSSTEQAQRDREQCSRERQLKRQVAGPMPPESWRDDFDRLSIRRGTATHLNGHRLQHLTSSSGRQHDQTLGLQQDGEAALNLETMPPTQSARSKHRAVCAGLRHFYDSSNSNHPAPPLLSLRDLAICVIADELNRTPSARGDAGKGKARAETIGLTQSQRIELLKFIPTHMRQRMMAMLGRFATTECPLSDSMAQALLSEDRVKNAERQLEKFRDHDHIEEDWETSADKISRHGHDDAGSSLDLSFSGISKFTLNNMISTMHNGQLGVSLRMLSLAGWNNSSTTAIDHFDPVDLSLESITTLLSKLPNLEVLSLAGSKLSASNIHDDRERPSRRAGSYLRKLSRKLPKLKTLDLSYCQWVSADAIVSISWATPETVAWPHLDHLVLVGCDALADPQQQDVLKAGSPARNAISEEFVGEEARNHIAPWHARHSPSATEIRGLRYERAHADRVRNGVTVRVDVPGGTDFNIVTNIAFGRHRDSASFRELANNTVRPEIIRQLALSAGDNDTDASSNDGSLSVIEHVKCPHSGGQAEMWQWERARILEAVRGRAHADARPRKWVEVWF